MKMKCHDKAAKLHVFPQGSHGREGMNGDKNTRNTCHEKSKESS